MGKVEKGLVVLLLGGFDWGRLEIDVCFRSDGNKVRYFL